MENDEKAVESASPAATSTGVELAVSNAPEADPESIIAGLKETLAKVERDRDNYRNATLAMKGKKEVEDLDLTDPMQVKVYIDKTVQDRLLETEEMSARKQLEDTALKLAKRNKELQLALNAKNASTSIAGGSSSGGGEASKSDAKSTYWSPDQVAEFKKRGWDDARIKRAETLARNGTAQSSS